MSALSSEAETISTNQQILDIVRECETRLENAPPVYLLEIGYNDTPIIFTDIAQAHKYVYREAINSEHLNEIVKDGNIEMSVTAFSKYFDDNIHGACEILPLYHLDITKPVYYLRTPRTIYLGGDPKMCVTNSLQKWIDLFEGDYTLDSYDYEMLEKFTVKINPKLPDLKLY